MLPARTLRHQIYGQPSAVSRSRVIVSAKKLTIVNTVNNQKKVFDQPTLVIGSKAGVDIRVEAPEVADEHVQITQSAGQVFIQSLKGDSENILKSNTSVWMAGNELRAGVKYPLVSGGDFSVGTQETKLTVTFEQASSLGATEKLLFQGFMKQGGFGDEVQGMLDDK